MAEAKTLDFLGKFGLRARALLLKGLASSVNTLATHNNLASMAKTLTKSQIAAALAEKVGITKKQAAQTLEALAELAYKHAKNSFTFPGVGKLVLVNRKARMGRNPKTGEPIKIPARKVVKFRVAKAAKVAILGR